MAANKFSDRHIGPREEDKKSMLSSIGLNSIEELTRLNIKARKLS